MFVLITFIFVYFVLKMSKPPI